MWHLESAPTLKAQKLIWWVPSMPNWINMVSYWWTVVILSRLLFFIFILLLVMEMVMTKQQSGLVKERNPTPQRLQLQAGRYLSDFCTNNLHCKRVKTNKIMLSHYRGLVINARWNFQLLLSLELFSNQQLLIFNSLILVAEMSGHYLVSFYMIVFLQIIINKNFYFHAPLLN